MQILTKADNYSRADVIPKVAGLKLLARSIARRSYPAIARQVMRNPKTRDYCLSVLEKQRHD